MSICLSLIRHVHHNKKLVTAPVQWNSLSQLFRGGMAVTVHTLVEICREVFADLGVGHCEKVYQKAIISILNQREIFHRSEVCTC